MPIGILQRYEESMKKIVLFIASTFITSCISTQNFKPYLDSNSIVRSDFKMGHEQIAVVPPEGAFRDKDGKLETTVQNAQNKINVLDVSDIDTYLQGHNCNLDVLYRVNLKQKSGLEKIKAKDFLGARSDLKDAKDLCEKIEWVSHQFYLEAIISLELGELEKAKQFAQKFLDYASTVEPRGFYSVDYSSRKNLGVKGIPQIDSEIAFYRKSAKDFINGDSRDLPLSTWDSQSRIALMYPNSLFRPGGSETDFTFFLPVFAFSSITGFSLGLSYYQSWGRFSLQPSYVSSANAGSFYGLTAKYVYYESQNRDTNLDVRVYGNTLKRLEYTRFNFGPVYDVKVAQEGFSVGAGLGGTRRFFIPSLGISAEAIGEQDSLAKKFTTYGSLFTFYGLTKDFDIFAGYYRNNPTAGFGLLFVRIGYDISDKALVTYINGMTF